MADPKLPVFSDFETQIAWALGDLQAAAEARVAAERYLGQAKAQVCDYQSYDELKAALVNAEQTLQRLELVAQAAHAASRFVKERLGEHMNTLIAYEPRKEGRTC